MIHTPLCDLLGIRYPIVQGAMAWVSNADLVAAVSEAGGLGVVAAAFRPLEQVAEEVRRTASLTDRPFGLNITLNHRELPALVALAIESKLPVVTTSAGNPAPIVPAVRAAGIKVIAVVGAVRQAIRAAESGVDAIVAEGTEGGGIKGDVSTMPLVPQVVDAVRVPVLAAGGIGDGRGLAAALALGAQGVQMGTRFLATAECIAHPVFKRLLLESDEQSTLLAGRGLGFAMRALKNPFLRQVVALEQRGGSFEEYEALRRGRLQLGLIAGDLENGALPAGQIAGLIRDVPMVAELLERIAAEAARAMKRSNEFLTNR